MVDAGDSEHLRLNRRWFNIARRLSSAMATLRQYESAATYAELASFVATTHHPGVLSSPALEQTLARVGSAWSKHLDETPTPANPGGDDWPQRVVHVATQIGEVGGHSRWILNWIRRDPRRQHSLALVGQRSEPVPTTFSEAIENSRGSIHVIDHRSSPKDKARRLIDVTAPYDTIILSSHPSDIIPSLAYSSHSHPPIIRLNHGDHRFWIGTTITDILVDFRSAGALQSRNYRGIPSSRSYVFPLPVRDDRRVSRTAARSALDLDSDWPVILTVGSKFKFRSQGGPTYLDLIAPALDAIPDLRVLIVGPTPEDVWLEAASRWPDRVRPLGILPDLSLYHSAADLYLESYPMGSATAALESGICGMPIVRFTPSSELALLWELPESVKDCQINLRTQADLLDTLVRLLRDDRQEAIRLGQLTRDQILKVHGDEAWERDLESVYRAARDLDTSTTSERLRAAELPRHEAALSAASRPPATLPLFARLMLNRRDHLDKVSRVLLAVASRATSLRVG
jgi:glycosyltransferase involved in cell wall biosynthesis